MAHLPALMFVGTTALHESIRQGLKVHPVTNTLAYP